MKRSSLIALGLAGTLAMGACARGDQSGSDTGPAEPVSAQRSYTPAPSGAVDEDTGQTITPAPVPSWDSAARQGALAAATTAMRTFARPDLTYDSWWDAVKPLMTTQAQQDYSYVDPANIPAAKITGPATLLTEGSAYTASVRVPTDAGPYTVLLIRQDGTSPWQASLFTPPEGTK